MKPKMKKINKKGSADVNNTLVKNLTLIAEIVVAVMLLVGAGSLAMNKIQDAENIIIARDIAFLIETISSSPYDLNYAYPINIEKKIIKIDNTSVTVVSSKNTVVESFTTIKNVKITESFIRNTLALLFYFNDKTIKFGDSSVITGENYCSLLPIMNKEEIKINVVSSGQEEYTDYLQKIKENMKLANKNSDGFKIEENEPYDVILELDFSQENNLSIEYDSEQNGFERIYCYLQAGLERTQNFDATIEIENTAQQNRIRISLGSLESLRAKLNSQEETLIYSEMEKYGLILMDALKKAVKNTNND